MKRYNSDNRHSLGAVDVLVDVGTKEVLYPCSDDETRSKPLYAFHSIVDKTFFKPGLSSISQVFGSNQSPVYDSKPNGEMPDYGVNIAWVRSKARDRVDIDLALEVVRETIERAKLEDAEQLKQAEKATKQLEKLGEIIKDNKSETAVSSGETSVSNP